MKAGRSREVGSTNGHGKVEGRVDAKEQRIRSSGTRLREHVERVSFDDDSIEAPTLSPDVEHQHAALSSTTRCLEGQGVMTDDTDSGERCDEQHEHDVDQRRDVDGRELGVIHRATVPRERCARVIGTSSHRQRFVSERRARPTPDSAATPMDST